jgi:hypothetical protein
MKQKSRIGKGEGGISRWISSKIEKRNNEITVENKQYEIPLAVRERHFDMLLGEAALVMPCKPMLNRGSFVRSEMDEFGYLQSADRRTTTKDDIRISKKHIKPPNVMKKSQSRGKLIDDRIRR